MIANLAKHYIIFTQYLREANNKRDQSRKTLEITFVNIQRFYNQCQYFSFRPTFNLHLTNKETALFYRSTKAHVNNELLNEKYLLFIKSL